MGTNVLLHQILTAGYFFFLSVLTSAYQFQGCQCFRVNQLVNGRVKLSDQTESRKIGFYCARHFLNKKKIVQYQDLLNRRSKICS